MGYAYTTLVYHFLLAMGGLLVFVFIAWILQQKRPPSASLAWIFFLLTLPYLAIPLYLAIGARKLHPAFSRNKARLFSSPHHLVRYPSTSELNHLLDSYGIPSSVDDNKIHFHKDGPQALDSLQALITHAQRQLDISVFILADDPTGRAILKQLLEKARQGVQIRLLLDGVGSFLLHKNTLQPLKKAGVEIAWFIPVLHRPFKGRTNMRNHRKLALADGCQVWSGGRNLAIEYFVNEANNLPWLDLSFDITGPVVENYQYLFEADWAFATNSVPRQVVRSSKCLAGNSTTRLLPSGPDVNDDPLQALLLSACFEAHQRILAISPYFVPDEALLGALCLAARRGVNVELILPRTSNHRLADIARGRYVRELYNSGARIYFLPSGMIHAKALVFDDQLALCGSANLDLRSLYLNFELMGLFYDQHEIDWLTNWVTQIQGQCELGKIRNPGTIRRILEGLVVLMSFQL